ncbi:putative leader peptide [Catenulispora sp. EB89]
MNAHGTDRPRPRPIPVRPALTARRHVDLVRVSSAICPV